MGYWRKRTREEIDLAVSKKDYTGGYKFWPWLLWMRPMYVLGFLGNLLGGWIGGLSGILDDPSDWIGYGVVLFFGVLVPTLIGFLLRRDYKEGQKGISR